MSTELPQAILNKARKDKFGLIFDTPPGLKDSLSKFISSSTTIIRDRVQFSIWGTVVPEISVPSLNLPYDGQSLKVSSHARPEYENLTVNFNIDNKYHNYWVIWFWLNYLNDAKASSFNDADLGDATKDYMRNYQTDITVLAYDEFNKPVMSFLYKYAFPVSLGRIEYNEQTTGEMEISSQFTFAFSQLQVEPIVS